MIDRKVSTDVKLLVVSVFVEAVGLWVSLAKRGLIAGPDFSNHLVSAVYLFSGNFAGMREPPLVPLITAFAVTIAGVPAYQILAPILFSIIAFPMFFILRELGINKWFSLLVSLAYINTPALTSIVVYGSLDRLVGIFFLLLSVYGLVIVVKKPSRRSIIGSALAMLAAVASHPFDLIVLVLGGGLTVILLAILSWNRIMLTSLIKTLLLAAVLSLTMIPFYLPIIGLNGSGGNPTFYEIRTFNLTYFISPYYSQFFPIQTILVLTSLMSIMGGILLLRHRRPNRIIIFAFYFATISLPFLAFQYQAIGVQFSFAFIYLGFAYFIQLLYDSAIYVQVSIERTPAIGISN